MKVGRVAKVLKRSGKNKDKEAKSDSEVRRERIHSPWRDATHGYKTNGVTPYVCVFLLAFSKHIVPSRRLRVVTPVTWASVTR